MSKSNDESNEKIGHEVSDTSDLDHFEVETRGPSWLVSTAMARHIETQLDASPPPEWITFVDLSGARIRVRTRAIWSISQSTEAQRADSHARWQRLREEQRARGEESDERLDL